MWHKDLKIFNIIPFISIKYEHRNLVRWKIHTSISGRHKWIELHFEFMEQVTDISPGNSPSLLWNTTKTWTLLIPFNSSIWWFFMANVLSQLSRVVLFGLKCIYKFGDLLKYNFWSADVGQGLRLNFHQAPSWCQWCWTTHSPFESVVLIWTTEHRMFWVWLLLNSHKDGT